MKGKVNCTCGWSWNKSDSSKKDMYICHECGRDNSNNMKNGGWLDNIPKAQTGQNLDKYDVSVRRTNMTDTFPYYNQDPDSVNYDTVERAKKAAEAYNADIERRYGPQNEYRTVKSAEKAAERLKQLKQTLEVTPIANNKKEEEKLENDNEVEEKSSKSKKYNNKKPKRKKEKEDSDDDSEAFIPPFILNAPNYTGVKPQFYDNVNNESKDNNGTVNLDISAPSKISYKDYINVNSANYRNAQKLAGSNLGLQLLLNDEKYKKDIDVLQKETDKNEYAKSLAQEKNKNIIDLNRSVNTNVSNIKQKNGGWLDQYADGGTMQEHQENYNNSQASAPEGMIGDGFSNVGRNYSPAWGGQFQEGGKLTFLQPTSDKLPEGYMKGSSIPSTERAMSIGGENGEPAYLIPSFKYGQELLGPVFDPISEFKRTGEHLGGPFKTWQEAEEWERTVRHPAVEKGENIMFPQEKFAMGGSILGATGHMYARVGAPSNGKYAKKTMPSAQNGVDMYGNPILADLKYDQSVNRTNYNPRTNQMIFGHDMPLFISQEQIDKTLAHENRHAWQFANDRTNFNMVHNPEHAFQDRLQKRPEMMSTDEVFEKYHNRKQKETEMDIKAFKGNNPQFSFMPNEMVYKKFVDHMQYNNPNSVEGEAQYYENTGKDFYKLQNGGEMQYYQQGLDWKPKSISRDGSVIKDDRGQWAHPGEITEIGSNNITMQGVPYDVLGISDTGDTKLMKPGKNYKFKGKKVTEYPMAQDGIKQELSTVAKDNTSVYNKERKKDKVIVPGTPVVPITHGNWLNKLITENITPYGYLLGNPSTMAPNKQLDDILWESSDKIKKLNDKYGYKIEENESRGTYSGERFNHKYTKINNPDLYKKESKKIRDDRNKKLLSITKNISDNKLSGKLKGTPRPERLNASQDALNLNQGIPQKYNSFVYSEYKPSKSKENKQYYSLAPQYEDEIRQDLFERRNADFINSKDKFRQVTGSHIADASLKDYQYSKGRDEKGDYVAYYDVNDYGNILDVLPNSNPFEIYGRIYYDKKTGKPIPKQKNGGEFPMAKNGLRQEQKGLQNLDNLINFTNYNTKQPGGWMDNLI